MLTIIPLVALIFLFLSFTLLSDPDKEGGSPRFRSAALMTMVVGAAILVLQTEFLNSFIGITSFSVTSIWCLTAVTCLFLLFKVYRTQKRTIDVPGDITLDLYDKTGLIGTLLIVIITGVIAVIAAPNNGDSQIYHLPRIFHWIQNSSVDHYPTNVPAQISLGPFSEFTMMHLELLSGTGRLAALVQWGSMVGCFIGVSSIVAYFKGGVKEQIAAAVICATIPMGILQATSTQTDYVCSFFMVCFVFFLLSRIKSKTEVFSIFAGLALGLAILTKAMAYLFAAPFILMYFMATINKQRLKCLISISVILSIAFLLNSGHYFRNFSLYGDILGSPSIRAIVKPDIASPLLFLSNIIKNLSLHLAPPAWASRALLDKIIQFLHGVIGMDVNDPRITIGEFRTPFFINCVLSEDHAGNFLFIVALAWSIVV